MFAALATRRIVVRSYPFEEKSALAAAKMRARVVFELDRVFLPRIERYSIS